MPEKIDCRLPDIGLMLPEIMVPAETVDPEKWAVVACDQFTSEPDYWDKVEKAVGGRPSAFHCILPESRLGLADEDSVIQNLQTTMRRYAAEGVLKTLPPGIMLVERRTAYGRTRRGMLAALDLECYDYRKNSRSLIRPTEGTILERLPPRIRVRKGAPLELPHILILIDDPGKTVIEPLFEAAPEEKCYDTKLLFDAGRLTGRFMKADAAGPSLAGSLGAIADRERFRQNYGADDVLLYAVGDGNHSLATAKAVWEDLRVRLTVEEQTVHPGRFALAEIVNLYDAGIVFEPIHRALFGLTAGDFSAFLKTVPGAGIGPKGSAGDSVPGTEKNGGRFIHRIGFYHGTEEHLLVLNDSVQALAVEALQDILDSFLAENPGAKVDYIHGDETLRSLAKKKGTLGFLLRPMEKAELFPTVIKRGVLPRKAFSIGEASEKRFYFEARSIEFPSEP